MICFYTEARYNESKYTISYFLSASIFDQNESFSLITILKEYEETQHNNLNNYLTTSVIKNKNFFFIFKFIDQLFLYYTYNNTDQTFNYKGEISGGIMFGQSFYLEEKENIIIIANDGNKQLLVYLIKKDWSIPNNKLCTFVGEYSNHYEFFYFVSYNDTSQQYNIIKDLDKKFDCSSLPDEHSEIPYFSSPTTIIISTYNSNSDSATNTNIITSPNSPSSIINYISDSSAITNIITHHDNPSSSIVSSTTFFSNYISDSAVIKNDKNTSFIPTTAITTTTLNDANNSSSILSLYPNEETTLSNDIIHTEKINITREKLMNELSSIIEGIEIGQIYQKISEDFRIFIFPTNASQLTAITHINFIECERKLRKYYNIPDSDYMIFLQIELETDNTKSLINQVEYQVYDGNKTLLDLSKCDMNIEIIYSIQKNSSINFDSANYFKDLGYDIFNINDSFFNDICEPYSESGDDLILEDRIKDIYKNYSLCEKACSYKGIDLENMTISCECDVKDNASIVMRPLNIEKVGGRSKTNFDVIKCYNLVFSLSNKFGNIGFWFFFVFFFHIFRFCFIISLKV